MSLLRLAKNNVVVCTSILYLGACSSNNFSDSNALGSVKGSNDKAGSNTTNLDEDATKDQKYFPENDESTEEIEPSIPEQEDDAVATPVMTTGAFLIKCEKASETELMCKVIHRVNHTLKNDISSISWDVYKGESLIPHDQIQIEQLEPDDLWQVRITVDADGDWRIKPVDKDQSNEKNYEIVIETPVEDENSPQASSSSSKDDLDPSSIDQEVTEAEENNFPKRYHLNSDADDRTGKENKASSFVEGSSSIDYELEYEFINGFTLSIWANTKNAGSDHPRLISITGDFEAFIKWDHENIMYAGGIGCNEDLIDQDFSEWVDSGTDSIDNEWHHLALTFDGNDLIFYYDGKMTDKLTTTKCTNKTKITSVIFNARETYEGILDDAKVFNKPLNENRILRMFESNRFESQVEIP